MKTAKRGFTLMELIVVIAILAILGAVAVPGFLGLREESESKVCAANADMLQRSYLARRAVGGSEAPEESLNQILAESPSLACPSGLAYETSFSGESLTITCPKHGRVEERYETLHGQDVSKQLKDVITKLMDDNVINGAANIDSAAIDKEGSRASKIEAALKEAGFSSGDTTWSIANYTTKNSKPVICWAEAPLPENAKVGDKMLVIRYNSSFGTYTVGYTQIIERNDDFGKYLTLDPDPSGNNTFKEYTDIAQTNKTDFSKAYEIYQQALAAQTPTPAP